MKKFISITSALLLAILFTACSRPGLEREGISEAQLRAGTWTVDHVEQNQYNNGVLVSSNWIQFGEGEEGGICTFTYTEDGRWIMIDNGEEYEFNYTLEENILETNGGGTWGVREMTDTYLEIVLRGSEVSNPCVYNAEGAVYFLTRSAATKQ